MMYFPDISLPVFSGGDLRNAASVLAACMKPPLPEYGFPCPFIAPGGAYGGMWWQMDYSLALKGLLWCDQNLAFSAVRNFTACQKADGRIPLWGFDRLPEFNGERLQREQTSS